MAIKVGVVGCGGIAQIEWLPYLHELDDYEVVALSDISAKVANYYGDLYNIPKRFTDWHDVIACTDIDAVIVLNTEHTEVCVAAANAGLDILVEKPLCDNMEQAEKIKEAVERNKVILMVGEMKRYDPGYQYARKLIQNMDGLRMIRSRDICDGLMRSINEIYPVMRRSDVDNSAKEELALRQRESLRKVTGSIDPSYFSHFLMAGIHDVEIMRSAFGEPRGVDYCDIWDGGKMALAILDYGDNVRATFEIGQTDQKWYEEELVAFGRGQTIRVKFPHPYVKNQPTVVEIIENKDGMVQERRVEASFEEAFRAELKHFYICVTERKEPITNINEGIRDVQLMTKMFQCYARRVNNDKGK